MTKITKKEIAKILRSGDRTAIFRTAHKLGLSPDKAIIHDFIKENAPSQKVSRNAYNIAYNGKVYYNTNKGKYISRLNQVIQFAKLQKKEGLSPYSKILILGNSNIYWASPVYQHSDYNKSIAFENNEKNREIAQKINNFLKFN